MMDFNERVIPGESANFLFQEGLARYLFAAKFIKKGAKVLDAGCGTGYGSAVLAKKAKVLGIDASHEAILFANKHYGSKADFRRADINNFNPKTSKFDAVCSFEVIEHLSSPNKFLRRVLAWLSPHGLFILSTPNAKLAKGAGSPYHEKEYRKKELWALLTKYFGSVEILGQTKNPRAQKALADFMNSQTTRQGFVNKDLLGLRKFLPKKLKEKAWKYLGAPFGRQSQEALAPKDFPIGKKNIEYCHYFFVICKNPKFR